MLKNCCKYSGFTDEELIEEFLKDTSKSEIIEFFIKKRCTDMLRFISCSMFESSDYHEILGEFYIFLQKNDWHTLRLYKNKNNAKFSTYLSRCATNYFMEKKKRMQKEQEQNISIESNSVLSEINQIAMYYEENYAREKECMIQALDKLEEGDRTLIDLLILQGRSSLDVADKIWDYVKSDEKDWRELPVKRVQDTIAMKKHRATLKLRNATLQILRGNN